MDVVEADYGGRNAGGDDMQPISDSKIGTIHSKPNVKHPMIRLPQEYVKIVGQRAHIYKTDHEGQAAFLVVPYIQESAQLRAESKPRVSKLSLETEAESRICSRISNRRA